MDFQSALDVYNKKLTKAIAGKRVSIKEINDMYESIEYLFAKDILTVLRKVGVVQSINARQEYLADYWENIHDYSLDLNANIIRVVFHNGEVVKTKLGSLKAITLDTTNISETHPLFLLAMGYLSVNALDTVCLAKVCERHLDQEI